MRKHLLRAVVSALVLALAGVEAGADVKVRKPGKTSTLGGSSGTGGFGATTLNNDPTDPISAFEPGELVVLNAPADFTAVVGSMGYQVIETVRLDGLGLNALRVRIPRGQSVPDASR
ncbi:MAG: hypothetical protein VW405_06285 [Rhodospirillaceae bacterium]